MRLTTAKKELKKTLSFSLISHLRWRSSCSFCFSSSPTSSCSILAVFCADHMPGAHVPSALAQILLLLGITEHIWLWMAGGGDGGELGGAGRAGLGWAGSIPGQEGAVGSAHPCVLLGAAGQGCALGSAWGMTRACADADGSWHLQDLLNSGIWRNSGLSTPSAHAVPTPLVALRIWCPTLALTWNWISSIPATDGSLDFPCSQGGLLLLLGAMLPLQMLKCL